MTGNWLFRFIGWVASTKLAIFSFFVVALGMTMLLLHNLRPEPYYVICGATAEYGMYEGVATTTPSVSVGGHLTFRDAHGQQVWRADACSCLIEQDGKWLVPEGCP